MTTDEIRADQRECNMCGETKSLEDYFRPFKGLEGQASAPRVKTCIKCERRFGWCPEKYKTKDLDEPINGPSITHQRKDSPTKENGDNQELTNEEPRLTLDEWEEITNTGKKIEEESPPTSKKQSPTNDPLADAKLVHGMLQRTSTPVVRVDNQCRYLHIPKQTIMRFPVIDSSSHMDLYVDSHGHPLILLHRSPGPSSRKIQRDQQIRSGGLKVSCKLYAEALGWEGGKRWVVESTSRSDVIKLVSAEK